MADSRCMPTNDPATWSTIVQAGASVVAVFVAGVAVWIAKQARDAEKAQASIANDALQAARRQMALSVVSFLRVDHPYAQWKVDYPYLSVTYANAGPGVAYAVKVSVMGAVGKGQDDRARTQVSGVLPALLQGNEHTTHVPISALRRDEYSNRFLDPFLTVVVEHRSPLGALVTATYDLDPTAEGAAESWSLRGVAIDLKDGGDVLDFSVE